MKCFEIIAALEDLAPLSLAYEWDNPGLLVGSRDKEVKKIYVALDVTNEVVVRAIENQADMIISHHPLIFSPLKSVTDGHFIGKRVYDLIRHDICCYGMHTNFDIAPGCMADQAAALIGIAHGEPLEVTGEVDGMSVGIGKVGNLSNDTSLRTLAAQVKARLGLSHVTVYGDLNSDEPIKKVAISPGAGKSMIRHALRTGAAVLITGDIGHQEGIDAVANGLAVIDAGHYGTEYLFVPFLHKFLTEQFGSEIMIETADFKVPNQVL